MITDKYLCAKVVDRQSGKFFVFLFVFIRDDNSIAVYTSGAGINKACKMASDYGAPFLDGVSIKKYEVKNHFKCKILISGNPCYPPGNTFKVFLDLRR